MTPHSSATAKPNTVLLILAFLSIYLIWGSTYLAIRYAIETLPPFLMGGARFLTAGFILYGYVRIFKGVPNPSGAQWKNAAMIGALLLFVGNGAVVWAEQYVASGITALIITTEPIWVVVLSWLWLKKGRPNGGTVFGIVLGMVGMAVLVGRGLFVGEVEINPFGVAAIVVATMAWAVGSLYGVGADLPTSPLLSTSMQMLAGGVLQTFVGTASGEWSRLDLAHVSISSVLALMYLIFFGSIVAFTAYSWLVKNAPPSRVATYAYVNPVIAVFLGWAMAGEAVTVQTFVAASILVGAVVVITRYASAH
jgi:drug/metabolite transporter (DMT)-like permease